MHVNNVQTIILLLCAAQTSQRLQHVKIALISRLIGNNKKLLFTRTYTHVFFVRKYVKTTFHYYIEPIQNNHLQTASTNRLLPESADWNFVLASRGSRAAVLRGGAARARE